MKSIINNSKIWLIAAISVILIVASFVVIADKAYAYDETGVKISIDTSKQYYIGDTVKITIKGSNFKRFLTNNVEDYVSLYFPKSFYIYRNESLYKTVNIVNSKFVDAFYEWDDEDWDDEDWDDEDWDENENENENGGEDTGTEDMPNPVDYLNKNIIVNSDGTLTYNFEIKKGGKYYITFADEEYGFFDYYDFEEDDLQGFFYDIRCEDGKWEVYEYFDEEKNYYDVSYKKLSIPNWVPGDKWTVKFDPNTGKCSTKTKTVTNGKTYGKLPKATKTDNFFKGWFTKRKGGKRVLSTDKVTLTGKITLYAHWASGYRDTIVKSKTYTLKAGASKSIKFTTDYKMIFLTPWELKTTSGKNIKSGGLQIKLKNNTGKTIQNDKHNLKGSYSWEGWNYSDGGKQKAGSYTYTFKNTSGKKIKLKVSIVGFYQNATKGSFKKKISVNKDLWKTIGTLKNGAPLVKKVTISNKKIISSPYIDENGNVTVRGLKKGKAKVTITLKNGKKYSTNVTVTRAEPDFWAYLYDYNTRNNYFVVKVTNNGYRDLTIIRSNSRVEDKDYKSYDRKIKDTGSVTIKSGETKKVRFYVSGSNTWPNYHDFTLYSTFKYDDIKWQWRVTDEDSSYKWNGEWYNTYFN